MVILDMFVMMVGFGMLSMMGVVKFDIISYFGISNLVYDLQYVVYVFGFFVVFLFGYIKFYEGSFKRSVVIVFSWVVILQFFIFYVGNWYFVVVFCFIQGFVVSFVLFFSIQIVCFFVVERFFVKGIIFFGIFWGGVFGSISVCYFVEVVGWKMGFVVIVIIMYVVLFFWWFFVEDFEIIYEKMGSDVNIWKMFFMWVFGLIFFLVLWVIFMIVGFFVSFGYDFGWIKDQVFNFSMIFNVLKVFWSIVMGFVGFQLFKKNIILRGFFKVIVQVMMIFYIIVFIGFIFYLKVMFVGNYVMVFVSVVFVGVFQGMGLVFWMSVFVIYLKCIYLKVLFVFGFILNFVNVIVLLVIEVLVFISEKFVFVEFILMLFFGILILVMVLRMRFLVEEFGE